MTNSVSLSGNPDLVDSGFDNPPQNPFELFSQWIENADLINIPESHAFILSTVNKQGIPSSRVVLLKGWDSKGILFCTSETSQKGKNIQENPMAAEQFGGNLQCSKLISLEKLYK
jgi:pyridoxine/pyridoxamine 5'-phosphate oxidase